MKIGYARTASGEDTLALQRNALGAAGCSKIFEDEGVGAAVVFKPALMEALRATKPGDTLVLWRLDRLACSHGTLLVELQLIDHLGAGLMAIEEGIEAHVGSSFFAHMRALSAFGDQVRTTRREQEARAAAAPGRVGRKPVIGAEQWDELMALMAPPDGISVAEVARLTGVSRQAIYKRLQAAG